MVEVEVRIDVDVEDEKGVPAPHWSDDEREASDCNSVLMTNFVPKRSRKRREGDTAKIRFGLVRNRPTSLDD